MPSTRQGSSRMPARCGSRSAVSGTSRRPSSPAAPPRRDHPCLYLEPGLVAHITTSIPTVPWMGDR